MATLAMLLGNAVVSVAIAPPAAAADPLVCAPGTFYSVPSGDGGVARIFRGTASGGVVQSATTAVGPATGWVGKNAVNGLGIAANGTDAYAFHRDQSGTTHRVDILRYNAAADTYTEALADFDLGTNRAITSYMIAGAVNPVDGKYYFGGYAQSGATFHLYDYNPATGVGSYRGAIVTGLSSVGNGDIAFDGEGNMTLLYAVSSTNRVFTISHASVQTASGGTIPIANTVTPSSASDRSINGIALDADGQLYIQALNSAGTQTQVARYDPNTGVIGSWVTVNGLDASTNGGGTDLASCLIPGSLEVKKNVINRGATNHQFTMQVSRVANFGTVIASGTTTGTATGIQAQTAGPIVGVSGATYYVRENRTSGNLSAYSTTYECIDETNGAWIAGGTLTGNNNRGFNFVFPEPSDDRGPQVVCTFTNATLPTLTLVKQVDNTGGGTAAPDDWTLTARAGSAAPVINEAPSVPTGDDAMRTSTVAITAGTTYTLSESAGAADYAQDGPWVCTGGTLVGGNQVSAAAGAVVVCTVTNAFQPSPAIGLVKSADPTTVTGVGQTVTYSFTATNTGNMPLSGVTFSDPKLGLVAIPAGATWSAGSSAASFLPGGTVSFTATYTATQADVNAGSILNTATVGGTPPTGGPVTDSDVATVTATQAPAITLVKSASPTSVTTAGQPVTYSFTATNTGNVTLSGVTFSDPKLGLVAIPAGATWSAGSSAAAFLPGGTVTFTVAYVVTQDDVDAGSFLNTASVGGTPPTGGPVTDTDEATVTATAAPAIDLVKSVDPGAVTAAGQSVTYSFTATNAGNVTLSDVSFTDSMLGVLAIPGDAAWSTGSSASVFLPGGTVTFTVDYEVTQGDVDAGSVLNTATVTGTAPAGGTVSDDDAATVTATAGPAITLVKSASPATVTAAGESVTYSFTATNTGNVTLSGVSFVDSMLGVLAIPGDATWSAGSSSAAFLPGGTVTFTAAYEVTQDDVDAGTVVNTATVGGTPPTGDPVTDTDDATVTATPAPAVSLVKSVDPGSVAAAGESVTYSFTATNTGNVTLSGVSFTDSMLGVLAIPGDATWSTGSSALAFLPGGTVTFTVDYEVTQGDVDAGSVLNTATVTGTPPIGDPVEDTDAATVTATSGPGITLVKSASPMTVTAAVETVTYSFTATNTGNVTLSGVSFTDSMLGVLAIPGDADWSAGSSASAFLPGGTVTFTVDYVVTQDDVDAGSFLNTATVGGTPPTGDPVSDSDDVTVTAAPVPSIDLVKSVDPGAVTAAGQSVTYSFTATNTGNATLSDVSFTDSMLGVLAIPDDATWSTGSSAAAFLPGGTVTFTVDYVVTQGDVDAGSVLNTATVAGTPPTGDPVTDTDAATVTATAGPAISLVKSASPATVTAAGESVTYSFTATNAGNVTLTDVSFVDSMLGVLAIPGDADWSIGSSAAAFLPGGTVTFTVDHVVTQGDVDAGSFLNTASVAGTPPTGDPVTDTDEVTVTAAPAPAIDLVKSVDPGSVTAAGQTVTYSFTATNTGNVTLSDVSFTDSMLGVLAIPGDATWSAGSSAAAFLPGGTVTFTVDYEVTQADVDAGSVLNTATVAGTPPTGEPVSDDDVATVTAAAGPAITLVKSASPATVTTVGETVSYSFTATNTGNVTLSGVSFTDAMLGLVAIPEDADWSTDSSAAAFLPGGTVTFTVDHVVTQDDLDAGSFLNTATVGGTPPTGDPVSDDDDATVTATAGPDLTLVKSASPATVTATGQTVTYSFTAENTGNVTLSNVTFADPMLGLVAVPGDASWSAGSSAAAFLPGGTVTFTVTYTATQDDVDAGELVNTATVGGTPPTGDPVTDSDEATVAATPVPSIDLVKSVDPTSVAAAGESVTYSFTAENTGNVTLSGVSFVDSMLGVLAIPGDAAWSTGSSVAAFRPGGTVTFTVDYVVTQGDVDAGSVLNTATVTGTPPTGDSVSDDDAATVTATSGPGITLVKSASPATVATAGETVTYSFTAENTGNVTLSDVSFTDSMLGVLAVPGDATWSTGSSASAFLPGGTVTFTVDYVVTQDDVDAGSFLNTATVAGTPPTGDPVTDTDEVTVTATPAPAISLVKSVNPGSVTAADQSVTYSFTAENTGNVTLSGVSFVDSMLGVLAIPGDATWSAGSSASAFLPGGTVTFTVDYVVTQGDVDAGSVLNTATVAGTPPTGDPVSDDDAATVTAAAGPAITLVKSASPATVATAGETVTYSFTATNTGNVTLSDVSFTDAMLGVLAIPGDAAWSTGSSAAAFLPGGTVTFTVDHVVTQDDIDAGTVVNTATVGGTPPIGDPVEDSDDATVTATPVPAISLVKSVDPTSVAAAGQTVTYSFTATNTGNVTLSDVSFVDSMLGVLAVPGDAVWSAGSSAAAFLPGGTVTFTVGYEVTQGDVDAGSVLNTATVVGTPPIGDPVEDTDAATVTATSGPGITLVKSASPATVATAGETVTYSFTAENSGNVTLSSVSFSDPKLGVVAVPEAATWSAGSSASAFLPGGTVTFTVDYVVTQDDVDNGEFLNTATVGGTPPTGAPVEDSDDVTVTATPVPSIGLVKSVNLTSVAAGGQSVTYSFTATNTGNVTLSNVSFTDSMLGVLAVPGDATWSAGSSAAAFLPGGTVTFTVDYVVTQDDVDAGSVLNTASVSGTPPTGEPVSDDDAVTVTATAGPDITLVKSASPETVTAAGESVTYSFTATNTGNVTLSDVSFVDLMLGVLAVPGDATWSAGSSAAAFLPGGTVTFTVDYVVTQDDVDAGSFRNTAAVGATPPIGDPVSDSDDATVTATPVPSIDLVKSVDPTSVAAAGQSVTYSFTATNTGNVTLSAVSFTDSMLGVLAIPGDATWSAGSSAAAFLPGGTVTFTVDYVVTQDDVDAGSVLNTATVAGTPPTGEPVSDDDVATVTAAAGPDITLVKSASPMTVTAAGETVTYSFTATNTGNVTLSAVSFTDSMLGVLAIPGDAAWSAGSSAAAFLPGGTVTFTVDYEVTQGDVDAGSFLNTATVAGTPPIGDPVTDTDDVTVTATSAPAVSLVKSVDPGSVTAAGQTVTYSFTATNTGNVTLTDVSFVDSMLGVLAIPGEATWSAGSSAAAFLPGGTVTFTVDYVVTQGDVDAGSVLNTATVSGTPPTGEPVTDTDAATVTAAAGPAITLVKSASPETVTAVGETVSYSFTATNTGNVTLSGVSFTDAMLGLVAIPEDALWSTDSSAAAFLPGGTVTFTVDHVVTQDDIDNGTVVNTATVGGTPPTGDPVTDTDDATVTATPAPAVSLVKSVDPGSVTAAGETVTYSFTATNTGNVTLSDVSFTDSMLGVLAVPTDATWSTGSSASAFLPGGTVTFTVDYVVTQGDVDAGSVLNTATVAGTPPTGDPVTDTDAATVTAAAGPDITLVKSASPATVTAVGQSVSYSFTATNTGNVTLSNVTFADPRVGLVTVPEDATWSAGSSAAAFLPGGTVTFTVTYAATQDDVDAGTFVNTATVGGTPPTGDPVTDTDTATVTAAADPAVTLVKSASPTSVTAAGQSVTYSFTATNTGNVTLSEVSFTDSMLGVLAIPGDATWSTGSSAAAFLPGGTVTFTVAHEVTQAEVDAGSFLNTATVAGTPPTGDPVTDTDTATVAATADPAITLVKTADVSSVSGAGQSVTYSFTATNTGNVTLTDVSFVDSLLGLTTIPGDATWSAGSSASALLPGGTVTFTVDHEVTQDDADAGSLVNVAAVGGTPPGATPPVEDQDTVTVTVAATPGIQLDKSVSPSAVSVAGQEVTYTFLITNTGNVTLTDVAVSDPLADLGPVTFGPWPGVEGELGPNESVTATATYTVTQADVDRGSVLNTATATGTPPTGDPVTDTDDATVTATATPGVAVTKVAELIPAGEAPVVGDTVTYTFTVTNIGNVTLSGVVLDDPMPGLSEPVLGPWPGAEGVLEPNQSVTATATYVLGLEDLDRGMVTNTVTATGTPPAGDPVDDDDTEVVPLVQGPAVRLVKSAAPAVVGAAGDVVTFTFTATNIGNVTLTGVGVTDPLPGLSGLAYGTWPTGVEGVLEPGQSVTATATYPLSQADVNAGGVTNTATVTGTPPAGDDVTDTDSAVVTAPPAAAITLVKSGAVAGSGAPRAGDQVVFELLVTNSGNVTLTDVTLTDPMPGLSAPEFGAWPGAVGVLQPGQTVTATATYTLTQADIEAGGVSNVAVVTGTPPTGDPVDDDGGTTVVLPPAPGISLVKSHDVPDGATRAVGDTVTFTFLATNTGNVTLSGVRITDPLPGLSAVVHGPWPGAEGVLLPGQSVTATATYVLTQADADAGGVVNTAEVAGRTPARDIVDDSGTAIVVLAGVPGIELVKSASLAGTGAVGDAVTFTFIATNTGDVTLTGVAIADPLPGLSALSYAWPGEPGVLAPGQAVTATATYQVTQADVDRGGVVNTAVVSGTPPRGPETTDEDTVTVTVSGDPRIELTKTGRLAPGTAGAVGDLVEYTFVVTNTGDVTLTGVTVADPLPGLSDLTYAWPGAPGTLTPGQSVTATATYALTAADVEAKVVLNSAVVSGDGPDGTVTDTDTHRLGLGLPLTGAQIGGLAGLALLLMVTGGIAVVASRRKEHHS